MMTSKECAMAWKEVVKIYKNTKETSPKTTMNEIVDTFGIEKTKEVFATVAAIKKHDGRIYGENRKFMESIPVNPEAVEWMQNNQMLIAGLDDIHTSHINQLITELKCM